MSDSLRNQLKPILARMPRRRWHDGKIGYDTAAEAEAKKRKLERRIGEGRAEQRDGELNVYQCVTCTKFHVGNRHDADAMKE